MNRYVYEVVSTNNKNGTQESEYFDSERAANKWKESRESCGVYSAEVVKWPLHSIKDI